MSEEDFAPLLARYRLAASDEPTPALDAVVLRAADLRAVRVRTLRRSVVVLALAAVALGTWPLWRAQGTRAPPLRNASGYGREEGATRYYLLSVANVRYTGPGSTEGRP